MTWECGTEQWLSTSESMARTVYHIDCIDPTEPDPIIYDGVLYASSVTVTFDDATSSTVKITSVYREYYVNYPTIIVDEQVTFFNSRPLCTTNNTGNAYWQICNTGLFYDGVNSVAQFYICNDVTDTVDPGGDPGEGGSGDGSSYLIVQYFNTSDWSGGCVLRCEQNNPLTGGGKCTVPTTVRMSLYPWGGSYSSSFNDRIIYDDFIIESEEIDDNYKWIPFFWNDLEPGEYVWSLQILNGPHDGTFSIHHDDNASDQKYPAWLNGYDHYNFKCDIFGLETDMTYEKVVSNDDSFGVTYGIYNGSSKIKTKVSSEYNNTPYSTAPYNSTTMRPCYMSSGINLSFEELAFTGWTTSATGSKIVERSEDSFTGFPTDGIASAKMHIPNGDYGYALLYQLMTFTNCTSLHDLHFDYYVPETVSSYNLIFQIFMSGSEEYRSYIDTEGLYTVDFLNVPSSLLLAFKLTGSIGAGLRTIYIDNIRFTGGGDYSMAPIGRMVGGSTVKTDV